MEELIYLFSEKEMKIIPGGRKKSMYEDMMTEFFNQKDKKTITIECKSPDDARKRVAAINHYCKRHNIKAIAGKGGTRTVYVIKTRKETK